MNEWVLYYNPQCGTCRKVWERIEARGVTPVVIEYLKKPPTAGELDAILKKIGAGPASITRMKEPLVEELGVRFEGLSRQAWLKVLAENPALIQRPIVVHGDRAVVARPPEAVDALFAVPPKR